MLCICPCSQQMYQFLMGHPVDFATCIRADSIRDVNGEQLVSQPPRHDALSILRNFLTAQAAKDCAIMVCMQCLPDACSIADDDERTSSVVVPETGVRVRYSVAFVDMDLKPVQRMQRYWALDRAVQETKLHS